MDIRGCGVRQVYVEERLEIERELYLSLTIDRSAREVLLIASAAGGMEIEAVPKDQIYMEHIPTLVGIQPYVLRSLVRFLGISGNLGEQVADIARRAYRLFREEDAELVEINRPAVTRGGRGVAKEDKEKGIMFIQLDGDIGVIANGAGLTMATLDVLNLKGGKGGTFL